MGLYLEEGEIIRFSNMEVVLVPHNSFCEWFERQNECAQLLLKNLPRVFRTLNCF